MTKYFIDVYKTEEQKDNIKVPIRSIECEEYIVFVRQRNCLAIKYCSDDFKIVCGEINGLEKVINNETKEK